MRGHEQISAARRRGNHPAVVWLDDGYNDGFARLAVLGCRPGDHIEVKATENPKRLDLRCVVGLIVCVSGSDERRVAALARACVEAGAAQVIAAWATSRAVCGDVQSHVHRITYTNGTLKQWP